MALWTCTKLPRPSCLTYVESPRGEEEEKRNVGVGGQQKEEVNKLDTLQKNAAFFCEFILRSIHFRLFNSQAWRLGKSCKT